MNTLKDAAVRAMRVGTVFTALWALGGCAYLTTYTRPVDLEARSYAMDIKQRVVVSKTLIHGERVICAEPSPDALTTLSMSAGAEAVGALSSAAKSSSSDGNDSEDSKNLSTRKNLAAALSEQGAFVGLRTQSIQLLRDAMYRLCEGYAAGALTKPEYSSMQKRYQNTMMGLLAIEQLTGPVVAAQVALFSNASASSGQTAEDTRVSVLETRLEGDYEALEEKEGAKIDAKVARDTAEDAVDSNEAAILEAERIAREAEKKRQDAEKETRDNAKVEKAAADAAPDKRSKKTGLEEGLKEKEQLFVAAEKKVDAAQAKLQRTKAALEQARGRATAAASGGGKFGAIGGASASMTDSMGKRVVEIVKDVNENYLLNDCLSFMIGRAERLNGYSSAIAAAKANTTDASNDTFGTQAINTLTAEIGKAVGQDNSIAGACVDVLKEKRPSVEKSTQ